MSVTEVGARSQFRIGNVVTRAWEVMKANFVLFFVISVLIGLPLTIFHLSAYGENYDLKMQAIQSGLIRGHEAWDIIIGYYRASGLVFLVIMVLSLIAYSPCILTAFQHLCGEPRPLGNNLEPALKRFFPLLGAGVVVFLGILVGSILFIIPGFMLLARWAISSPVCVIERTGPMASLKRSAQLTDGSRWRIFGLFLLVFVPVGLIAFGIAYVLTLSAGRTAGLVGSLLMQGVFGAYSYGLFAAMYYELRRIKEGVGNQEMMAVFE